MHTAALRHRERYHSTPPLLRSHHQRSVLLRVYSDPSSTATATVSPFPSSDPGHVVHARAYLRACFLLDRHHHHHYSHRRCPSLRRSLPMILEHAGAFQPITRRCFSTDHKPVLFNRSHAAVLFNRSMDSDSDVRYHMVRSECLCRNFKFKISFISQFIGNS